MPPITGELKLDELYARKLDWGDKISEDLRKIWISNLVMFCEIKIIRFNRAIIPKDAASLVIETIDTADVSNHLICCAIYARFQMALFRVKNMYR